MPVTLTVPTTKIKSRINDRRPSVTPLTNRTPVVVIQRDGQQARLRVQRVEPLGGGVAAVGGLGPVPDVPAHTGAGTAWAYAENGAPVTSRTARTPSLSSVCSDRG
jgi:hypothetical protein